MSLESLLEPSRVLANVDARSRKHALEILSELIAGSSESLLHIDVLQALLERERIGNTGLGNGIAIPHGRLNAIDTSIGAFLKLNEAVDFNARDGQPVSLIFAVVMPENAEDGDFENVVEVANALSDPQLVDAIIEASGSRAVYDLLSGYLPHAVAVAGE